MEIIINNFSGGIDACISGRLADFKKAQMCYNFNFSGGNLKHDVGFEPLFGGKMPVCSGLDSLFTSESGVCDGFVFLYRRYDFEAKKQDDKLIIFDSTHTGYYINLFDESFTLTPLGVSFSSRPVAENYRLMGKDVVIMVSSEDNMVVWDGVSAPEIIIDAPKISSMDIHYERLFATSKGSETLRFSDDLDPTNWSESLSDAGFIELVDERGKLEKVLSFNDYLYVFRERGVSRVYASSSDQRNFYVNHLFTAGGSIIPSTIAICGDKIIFAATDGLYAFDGSSTVRKLENLFPLFNFSSSVACFHAGKYYLAAKLDFDGEKMPNGNNALLELDAETFEYKLIRGRDIIDLCSFSCGGVEGLVILSSLNGGSLEVLSTSGQSVPSEYKSWLSCVTTTKENKVVRKVCLSSFGDSEITLFNEKGEELKVCFSGGEESKSVFFPFKKLGLKLKGESVGTIIEEVRLTVF